MGSRVGAVLVLVVAAACGSAGGSPSPVAAVALTSGSFGALMASDRGEQMLPLVQRDPIGVITGPVQGVLWMNGDGVRVAVLLDPVTGLPTRTVLGDYVLVFANWDTAAGTVDIARVFGPTSQVTLFRGVSVPAVKTAKATGAVESALTCFPACTSDRQNLSELLKIGGAALSVGSCIAATTVSLGAMALPCAGVVVSTASLVLPDSTWLDDTQQVGRILSLTDALECTTGNALGCVSFFDSTASEAMDLVTGTVTSDAPLITAAQAALADPAVPSGPVQGTPPPCTTTYECTPGAYLPCLAGGTRQCSQACAWGECPSPGTGDQDAIGADVGTETATGANKFDGTWTMQFKFSSCSPTDDQPISATITIADGKFVPGLLFTFDAHGDTETMTMLDGGTVSDHGEIDGYDKLSGSGCGDDDNFYGGFTSTTRGDASSYWASITFSR